MKINLKHTLSVTFASLILISTCAYSQKPFKSISNYVNIFNTKSITDTLRPLSFITGTITLDSALAGGYVCGTNAYQDIAKAQIYYIEDSLSYFVKGCALDIGNILINNDTDTYLTVNVYDLSGMGYNNEGVTYDSVPGNILYSVSLPVSLLTNNQINYIHFTDNVWVINGYALGIDFSAFGTNQIGLISTSDGDAHQSELAWEKLNNGQWHSMLSTWPFDGDMGIFSLIDGATAGINNINKQDINIISVYPNPVNNNTLNISYKSASETSANISLYNIHGISLYQNNLLFSKGEKTTPVNLPTVKPGNYFLSIKTLNNNYIKNITIL